MLLGGNQLMLGYHVGMLGCWAIKCCCCCVTTAWSSDTCRAAAALCPARCCAALLCALPAAALLLPCALLAAAVHCQGVQSCGVPGCAELWSPHWQAACGCRNLQQGWRYQCNAVAASTTHRGKRSPADHKGDPRWRKSEGYQQHNCGVRSDLSSDHCAEKQSFAEG